MKEQTKKEIKIGLSVLGALVILYFGIEFLKGHSPLSKHTEYYAVYDDVLGLQSTANVNLSGLKVGQVSSVELIPDRPGKVLVSFRLDKPVDLTVGSTAAIEKDLLGTSSLILNLAPGTLCYSPGDTIPGVIASGMMSEISEMLPEVTGIIPKIDTLLTNINNVVGHPSLANTISNFETVSAGLKGLIGNVDRATRPLPGIVAEADSLIGKVDAIADNIHSLTQSLADAPIDSTLSSVNQIASNLAALTSALSDPSSSVGQLISSPDVYNNLKNVTADIDSLIVDIKRNPKRYISIKLL